MHVVANRTLACLPAAAAVELNELEIVSECTNLAPVHAFRNCIITTSRNAPPRVDMLPGMLTRLNGLTHCMLT